MKKKAIKATLRLLLKIFKPQDRSKFLDIAAGIMLLLFEIPIIAGVLAMGAMFDKFYLSIFALANTMFWRRNHGDHSPTSCFVASIAIFTMFFVMCSFINNNIIEYGLSVVLAFFFINWKII